MRVFNVTKKRSNPGAATFFGRLKRRLTHREVIKETIELHIRCALAANFVDMPPWLYLGHTIASFCGMGLRGDAQIVLRFSCSSWDVVFSDHNL